MATRNPKANHLGWYSNPVDLNKGIKLPTSTGEFAGFLVAINSGSTRLCQILSDVKPQPLTTPATGHRSLPSSECFHGDFSGFSLSGAFFGHARIADHRDLGGRLVWEWNPWANEQMICQQGRGLHPK